jgi:hypothetical protein
MSERARKNSHRKPPKSGGMRARADIGDLPGKPDYPSHARTANDNKAPMWRAVLGWTVVGLGVAGFAIVAAIVLL